MQSVGRSQLLKGGERKVSTRWGELQCISRRSLEDVNHEKGGNR